MQYFVTGATGFIGKRLVKKLLQRKGAIVHFLIRKESAGKVEALREYWGVSAARAVPVHGDLTAKKLGVSAEDIKKLKGQIDHFHHLAAVYDLSADEESQIAVNVEGTRHTVEFAKAIDAGHFHHVSSIAAAGLYEGVFREDMFEEAENYEHPYFMTKHESEKIVRKECKVPWTVFRPAMVVGDSTTGEMDKIDGPYYFFKLIQRMRQLLPPWMPAVGLEGGRINIVPVDFVVDALDVISHKTSIAKKCFHLVDPVGYRVGDVLDIFSRAAHAPKMNLFVNAALLGFIPRGVKKSLMALAPVRRVRNAIMADLGLPEDMLTFVNYPTRFDCRETLAALKGSGVECPNLKDYAWRVWDYWERHLDPDLHIDRSLRGTVSGKVVLITGGSSGIGLAAAHKFAEAGAITIICGRDQDKLDEACKEANGKGYHFIAYPADIADMADCDRFVQTLIANHGSVDFLINNAGRSIRRAIEASYDRFHDFERTMQLNYFGCLRVTMGFLPGMVAKRKGHVVNISSIGVLTNAPRFSAYVASKSALDAWTRCASSEFADQGITFTTINMPLVRTPMIAPT
ncbi:MAG: SDR family oxidoreductase, partial [Pseudomonadota bacterium]